MLPSNFIQNRAKALDTQPAHVQSMACVLLPGRGATMCATPPRLRVRSTRVLAVWSATSRSRPRSRPCARAASDDQSLSEGADEEDVEDQARVRPPPVADAATDDAGDHFLTLKSQTLNTGPSTPTPVSLHP